jgi:hypothetical protein
MLGADCEVRRGATVAEAAPGRGAWGLGNGKLDLGYGA